MLEPQRGPITHFNRTYIHTCEGQECGKRFVQPMRESNVATSCPECGSRLATRTDFQQALWEAMDPVRKANAMIDEANK